MFRYSSSVDGTDSTTNTDTTEGSDLGHDWYYSNRDQYESLFGEMEVLRDIVETAGVLRSEKDSEEDLDAALLWRTSRVVKTMAAIRLRISQEHRVLHHGSYKDFDKTELLARDPLGCVINCPADVSCRAVTESHNVHKHIDKRVDLGRDGLGHVDRRPERITTPSCGKEVRPIPRLQATLHEMVYHFGYPRFLAAVYSTCILWLMVVFFTSFGGYATCVMWATILLGVHYLV